MRSAFVAACVPVSAGAAAEDIVAVRVRAAPSVSRLRVPVNTCSVRTRLLSPLSALKKPCMPALGSGVKFSDRAKATEALFLLKARPKSPNRLPASYLNPSHHSAVFAFQLFHKLGFSSGGIALTGFHPLIVSVWGSDVYEFPKLFL